MNRRVLIIAILVMLTLIFGLILFDFMDDKPDKRGKNPFALKVDHLRDVDEKDVSHKESRQFGLGGLEASDMFLFDGKLYVAGKTSLGVVGVDGSWPMRYMLEKEAGCIAVDSDFVYLGHGSRVAKYNHSAELIQEWEDLGERTVLTNLAIKEDKIYVADAGNRRVVIYNREGERQGMFEGKAGTGQNHGFIVPSANFDLTVDVYGELWVVNPGKHAVESYSDDGRLRGFWGESSQTPDGFLGCCNPARIAALDDGAFVTGEKGMTRIKIHEASGKFRSWVAAPGVFKEGDLAPIPCAGAGGVIYALDREQRIIRVFEPKESVQ